MHACCTSESPRFARFHNEGRVVYFSLSSSSYLATIILSLSMSNASFSNQFQRRFALNPERAFQAFYAIAQESRYLLTFDKIHFNYKITNESYYNDLSFIISIATVTHKNIPTLVEIFYEYVYSLVCSLIYSLIYLLICSCIYYTKHSVVSLTP